MSRGTVYHLLSNPVYIGKTLHKGVLHPGKHEPILNLELWNRVSDLLKHNRVNRRRTRNVPSGRMLLGRLKTASGLVYTPTHSAKGGRRYFYYTLKSRDITEPGDIPKRLPAIEVEDLIFEALASFFADTAGLADHLPGLTIQEMQLLSSAAREKVTLLRDGKLTQNIGLVRRILADAVVLPGKIRISLRRHALRNELLGEACDRLEEGSIVLEERFHIAKRGGEARLILSDGKSSHGEPIPSLIGAIVQARTWAEWIVSGKVVTLGDLARRAGRSRQYTTRILRLAALSPELVDSILLGDHSPSLTVPELTARFPLEWVRQC